MGKANVIGVGIGKKVVAGEETEDPAVIVFVERKLPEPQLRKKDIVPKTLDEVKTDVVETGRLKAQAAMAGGRTRTDRWRPAPGGVSLGHIRITAGTLGGVVRVGGRRVVLSNNHILANSNAARIGDPILQPGPADSGTRDDTIATLERFVEIHFDDAQAGGWMLRLAVRLGIRPAQVSQRNLVDAGIAKPLRDDLVSDTILDVPRTPGMGDVTVGTPVKKSGRTTGVTEGKILATDATVQVDYDRNVATFTDQLVAGPMFHGGGSGPPPLDAGGRAGGLVFARGDPPALFHRARRGARAPRGGGFMAP